MRWSTCRESAKAAIDHPVNAMVAGAAPPAKVIGAVEEMGIKVTHVYGLTETYGPVTLCAWHAEWDELPLDERAQIKVPSGRALPDARRRDGRRFEDTGAHTARRPDHR